MIYDRKSPEKPNTAGVVYVAEMDGLGRRTASPDWRHIYLTPWGKEYIYGLTDHEWKVYTQDIDESLAAGDAPKIASPDKGVNHIR